MRDMKQQTKVVRSVDGKYMAKLSRVCVCGHALGVHDAEKPYPFEDADCDGFKKAKNQPE